MIRSLLSIALCSVVLLTGGCAAFKKVDPTIEQRDSFIQTHPDVSELDKTCVYDNRFEVGILQETVRFLLGEPLKIEIVHQPWATQENWIYRHNGKMTFIIEENRVVGILQDN